MIDQITKDWIIKSINNDTSAISKLIELHNEDRKYIRNLEEHIKVMDFQLDYLIRQNKYNNQKIKQIENDLIENGVVFEEDFEPKNNNDDKYLINAKYGKFGKSFNPEA